MGREQLITIPWPKGGYVENASFYDQPDLTTTRALNVRNFDAIERKDRGGQRTGISKYLDEQINSNNAIQALGSVVLAFDSATIVIDQTLFEETFSGYADAAFIDSVPANWDEFRVSGTTVTKTTDANREVRKVTDGSNSVMKTGPITGANDTFNVMLIEQSLAIGSAYVVRIVFVPPVNDSTAADRGGIMIGVRYDKAALDALSAGSGTTMNGVNVGWQAASSASSGVQTVQMRYSDTSNSTVFAGSATALGSTFTVTNGVYVTMELRVNGDTFQVYVDNVLIGQFTSSVSSSNGGIVIGLSSSGNVSVNEDRSPLIDLVQVFTGTTPASLRNTKIVAVAGGTIKTIDPDFGLLLPTNGTGAQFTSGPTAIQDAYQKVYFADGFTTGYKVLDAKTNQVSDWIDSVTAGALPTGGTGTQYTITAVDTSTRQFTVAQNLSAIVSAGDYIVVSNSLDDSANSNRDNDGSYTVASVSGTGPTIITVNQTVPSTSVSGTLAVGNVACRILALFAGSIFASGLETDPQNWFCSASGDPNNWDYFPTVTSQIQAVAGNNGLAGRLGDVITALAPYNDDTMVMGGANSLAVMRGHPAAGGAIDLISQKIGIVGPTAWTFDSGSNFYFFSVNGFYRMDLNSFQPVLLSQKKLDQTFSGINTSLFRVLLTYDPEWQGVHIFFTPKSQPTAAPIHYFWDERSDAFWPDEYPITIGPTAILRYNADDPEDSALLLGSWDGYLRSFDSASMDDDGTVITSYCQFTPITPGSAVATSRLHDIVVILDADSNAATLKLYAGDTPEAAVDNVVAGNVKISKALVAGRNSPVRQRLSQNSVVMEISQSGDGAGAGATWAFERAMGRISVLGRVHGKGV